METTQPGVSTDQQFQGLWDAGAFGDAPPEAQQQAQQQAEPQQEQQGEPAAKETPPEQPQQPEQAEQEETFEDLDALLRAKGFDPESARSLPVTVKVDGVERKVSLADVIKSFQLEGHVNNKSIELSNQQKAWEAQQAQAREVIQQQFQMAQNVAQVAQNALLADYQKVDWNALRASDPGQFAALQHDFMQRQAQIQGAVQQIEQQRQAELQQQQQQIAQSVQQQRELMLAAKPEWRDPAKFAEARNSMVQYAKAQGFSDADLGQITDHRMMGILHDAASYAALQASQPAALKKVREAPPLAKAGTRTNTDPRETQMKSAMERLRANPNDNDAAASVFQMFA